jgi:hypothetical protein
MTILRTCCPARKGLSSNFDGDRPVSTTGDLAANPLNTRSHEPFPVAVPDYIQADWHRIKPTSCLRRGRQRIGSGLYWAIHQAVIVQKTSRVILPDLVLAHVLWGDKPRWPRNWRQRIVQRLKRAAAGQTGLAEVIHREVDTVDHKCPPQCPLHGSSARHHHLEIAIRTPPDTADRKPSDDYDGPESFLGALEVFGYGGPPDRLYHWSPRTLPELDGEPDAEEKADKEENQRLLQEIKGLKRDGSLTAVYLPLNLFGSSPRVGLSLHQRQLLFAITRELTRSQTKAKYGRPDKAEIVIGGQMLRDGIAPCPYLDEGERHVAFNGNGRREKQLLRGRGYRPLVWMGKAGYAGVEDEKLVWRGVRSFLRDFKRLAEVFGLVVAAWHPRKCSWRPLADLLPFTRNAAGRAWLRRCLLRVYTSDDFLVRWRCFFAKQMGFSVIPDTRQEQGVDRESPDVSPLTFFAYLNEEGISCAELATQLGVSRSLVSRHLSGKRLWTPSWQKRISAWLEGRKDESKVSTYSL